VRGLFPYGTPTAASLHGSGGPFALKTDAKEREQALQDCGETNQDDQDFEQVSEPPIAHEPVNDPKQDRADNAYD
jgi:hypothetical protein